MSDTTLPRVMIVDDTPTNIKILVNALAEEYELSVATNGRECLDAVLENPPDLILLDIMMPEMDGYEACTWLKHNDSTCMIPIIFLTAKNEVEDETKGLTLGAVDYITKPFSISIVKNRVKNQLDLKKHRDQLEQLVEGRTQQLIHADRLSTMGTFSAGIAHEINNPNTFITANVQTLKLFWQHAQPLLKKHIEEDNSGKVGPFIDEVEQIFESILQGSERISTIIKSLKTYARQGSATKKERISLIEPVNDAVMIMTPKTYQGVTITIDINKEIKIDCDAQKMSQVFVNLINNALDAFGDEPGTILITAHTAGENIVVSFKDNGSGIPEETQKRIFNPFFTTKDKANGTGLGLAIIQGIIEEHKGTISVESTSGTGTEFTIHLPQVEI